MTSRGFTIRRRFRKPLWLTIAVAGLVAGPVLWPRPVLTHDTESTTTTVFDREVVRILNTRCVSCHAESGVTFPLVSYEDAWFKARSIKMEALARHMPPWSAVPGYGHFANDNGLTAREIEFLVSWADGGGPRNTGNVFLNVQDSAPAPKPKIRAQADFDRWQLGEPGLTRPLPPIPIGAGNGNPVVHIVVDLGLKADSWMRGLEYMPGDRRAVRAAAFTLQETGQWLGSWTPWYGFVSLPPDTAFRLPAGSHIAAEIYTQEGKQAVVEQGALGLFLTERPAVNTPSDLVLELNGGGAGTGTVAPGSTTMQRMRTQASLASDTYVWALRPQIPAGVTSVEVSARRPDGGTEILLFAKDVRIEWPTPYLFTEPVRLPKGTELAVTAYSDPSGPRPGPVRLTVSRYAASAAQ